MRAFRKIKFCLVLCVWLSKKYKSLLASKIQRCKNCRRQHLSQLRQLGSLATPSYTQLATQLSYSKFSFLLFVFGVCLLQPVARRAAKLLIAGQVLELASLASQLLSAYVCTQGYSNPNRGLRIFFLEKEALDFLGYSLKPWKFQTQFHPWKFQGEGEDMQFKKIEKI